MKKDQEIKRLKDKLNLLEEERAQCLEQSEDLMILSDMAETINRLNSADAIIDTILEDICILKEISYASFLNLADSRLKVTNEYIYSKLGSKLDQVIDINQYPGLKKIISSENIAAEDLKAALKDLVIMPNGNASVAILAMRTTEELWGFIVICCLNKKLGAENYLPLLKRVIAMAAARIEKLNFLSKINNLNMKLLQKYTDISQELRLSEHKYHTLFEKANDAIYLLDPISGQILDCNRKAAELDGRDINKLLTMTVEDLHPADELPLLPLMINNKPISTDDAGVVSGLHHRRRDGRLVPVEINAATVNIEGKKAILSVVRDITERKEAKLESINYINELEILNNIISTISSSLDTDSVLKNTIKSAVELIAGDAGSIALYDPQTDVMNYPYHFNMPEKFKLSIAKKGTGLAEYVMKTGKSLIIEDYPHYPRALSAFVKQGLKVIAAVPIAAKNKNIGALGIFGFSWDKKFSKNDIKLLEAVGKEAGVAIENARLYSELKELSANLERRVRSRTRDLEKANDKLLDLDRLKSMFIASTSHELRTPLNSIIGFSGILLEGWSGQLSPEQAENLNYVYQAGKHLLALINDIIDISKIESGKLDKKIEDFKLKNVVDEALVSLKTEITEKSLDLTENIQDITMRTDRQRLLQCLVNLISNAVKFTESGEIRLAAKSVNGNVNISVSDTGIGIKKSDLDHLFKPFTRLETPLRDRTSGTGLGLYLTRKLAKEALSGRVEVSSEYRRGSTFSLEIPVERDGK